MYHSLRYNRKSRHRRIKKRRRYERLAATSQLSQLLPHPGVRQALVRNSSVPLAPPPKQLPTHGAGGDRDRERDQDRDRDSYRRRRSPSHRREVAAGLEGRLPEFRQLEEDRGSRRDSGDRDRTPPKPTEDERDRETAFVQQVAARLRTREPGVFFGKTRLRDLVLNVSINPRLRSRPAQKIQFWDHFNKSGGPKSPHQHLSER
ncbi:hypothetical protein V8F20_008098 [Naviculisporaceae sp. PSN 640]